MGTLFKIAWRNVRRHGKRTALTVVTMAFGLGLFIAMDSILKGMDRGGLQNIIDLTDSSVRVSTKAYEEERRSSPLEYGLPDVDSLEKLALADPRALDVAPRTRFIGRLSNGLDSIPVLAVAVDPERDARVFKLSGHVAGSWFPGGGERQIVLGRKLAADLGIALGDWVVLAARTRWEAQNADDFRVVGLIDSSEPSLNSSGVFISFADAEDFLELEGLRTELAVSMERRTNLADAMGDSDALAAAIGKAFPDLDARSFGEVGREFLQIAKAKSKGASIIIFTILLIAGVGIANTVLMSVYSRIREIGVLRAYGFRPKDISRLFLMEGAIIGLSGSLAGVAFGLAAETWFVKVGLPVDKLMGEVDMGLPVWGTLYGEWNPSTMAAAVVFGVLVALLASRSPARKAARLQVTDALRFV